MKMEYTKPVVEKEEFVTVDVITTSVDNAEGDDD